MHKDMESRVGKEIAESRRRRLHNQGETGFRAGDNPYACRLAASNRWGRDDAVLDHLEEWLIASYGRGDAAHLRRRRASLRTGLAIPGVQDWLLKS